ncbi:hypothetical protein D9M72_546660 [compost metagenome]
MVEHREDIGFQDAGLSERRLHNQDGGVGKVRFALGIAPDVSAETEPGQIVQGFGVDHSGTAEEVQLGAAEPEVRDALQQPACSGHDPVAAAVREPAGERLKHRLPVCGTGVQRGLEHGQLVMVGVQGRAGMVPASRGTHEFTLVRIALEWTDDP